MSNPTSNFGWQMPTPTDLVTDLPADFEVFGQAVDTDFVDLLGGTTGQILSKTSATDLDFTWISPNPGDITEITVTSPITGGGSSGSVGIAIQDATTAQKGAVQLENSTSSTSTTTAAVPANVKTANDLAAAAIPKSTITTNGDLIYGTGSAAVTRLGIGSAGNVLTVASGIPSWAAPSAGALTLINTTTFTTVASVSVNSVFTSTYTNYLILTDSIIGNGNLDITMRLRAGGTDTTANYNIMVWDKPFATAVSAPVSIGTTSFGTGNWYIGDTDGTGYHMNNIYISSPQKSTMTTFTEQIITRGSLDYIGGNQTDATAFDGFTFTASTGTFSGVVRVYGYAKT